MIILGEAGRPLPPYKLEFIAWLSRYKGADKIVELVRHCEYSPEDLDEMKRYFGEHLVLKEEEKKEADHASALG